MARAKENTAENAADNAGTENRKTVLERKITNKVLFSGDSKSPALPRDNNGEPVSEFELGTVYGIARSVQTGESQNGPWTALVGSFEAMTHDGRKIQAPKVFLPDPLNTMLAETLADENTESVQFGVRVKMVHSNVPIGYEYKTETLVEPDNADPLADLRSRALPSA